jgi:hypothetical protein
MPFSIDFHLLRNELVAFGQDFERFFQRDEYIAEYSGANCAIVPVSLSHLSGMD